MRAELARALLGAFAWLVAVTATRAPAQAAPTVYVVHVDAHESLGELGALEAAKTILDLSARLRALSALETQIFGAIRDTEWQIIVSAGQRENGTLVTRLEADSEQATPEQLGQWIASKITGAQSRSGAQVSLWPLQQLVAQLPDATDPQRHQLIRLAASAQDEDIEKNIGRVTLLRKRVEPFVAALDLDMAPLRLEAEGWRPIARSRIPSELSSAVMNGLIGRIDAGVARWSACDRVLLGSSLVDVLLVGGTGGQSPGELLKVEGQLSLPERWDLDVGRIKFLRIDDLSGLTGLSTTVSTQGSLRCRFDSRAQPSWELIRDGRPYAGEKLFRSERLVVKVKTTSPLSANGLTVNVTRDGQSERLCDLEQALKDGCNWQPTKLGAHTLTLVEPSGAPWEILSAQRKLEVVAPASVLAQVKLSEGICPGDDTALPFADKPVLFFAPAALCVDYQIELVTKDFELTPEQRLQALSSLRLVVAKGEQTVRTAPIDGRSGKGQARFLVTGDESGEDIVGAGEIAVRVVNAMGPSVFRDPVADLTYEVSFSEGSVSPSFELYDYRLWVWGGIATIIFLAIAISTWLARRAHQLELDFRVRGWSEAHGTKVNLRVSASPSEHREGLRPALGLSRIDAKRILGGYRFIFTHHRHPVVTHTLKGRQNSMELGPFVVNVRQIPPARGDR